MLCQSGHPARKKTSAPRSGGRATIRGWTPASEEPDVDTFLTVASKFARTLHRKPHFEKASYRRSRRASALGALQGPAILRRASSLGVLLRTSSKRCTIQVLYHHCA